MDDQSPEKREPLAALHTYEPVPSNKLYPKWERISKFGWIVALAVAGVVGYRVTRPVANPDVAPIQRFEPVSQWTSESGLNLAPAISHDGKLVAYASDREGSGGLAIWTRPFDSDKPVRLTSGEFNETDPDFSPDGRLIAYRSEREGGGIYLSPVGGDGQPKLIAKHGSKPRFSPDGKWIAFFTVNASDEDSSAVSFGRIFVVPTEGGEPRRIQPSFPDARYPIWAPDGSRLLFTGTRQDGVKDWWLSPIGEGGQAARTHAMDWLSKSLKGIGYPDRWWEESIFFSGAEETATHIWALPISGKTMQVTGPPQRLTDGKDQEQQVAIGAGGRLLFTGLRFSSDIWSLPIDANRGGALGKLTPFTNDGFRAQTPSIAADGSRMVYVSNRSGARDVWVSDMKGKPDMAVTSFLHIGYRPLLSPDGRRLVYPGFLNGRCTVVLQDLEGPVRPRELKGCFNVSDWSPDGSSLLTFRAQQANTVDLVKIATGERQTALSYQTGNLSGARFSPDGRWIAFAGATAVRRRIFVAPWRGSPVSEREWMQVSPENSGDPAWSPDGSVLYFHSKRDGFLCVWAQKLGVGKKPAGEPTAILHLHSGAMGIGFLKSAEFGMALAKDRLILNLGRSAGNLQTMTLPPKKAGQVTALSPSR